MLDKYNINTKLINTSIMAICIASCQSQKLSVKDQPTSSNKEPIDAALQAIHFNTEINPDNRLTNNLAERIENVKKQMGSSESMLESYKSILEDAKSHVEKLSEDEINYAGRNNRYTDFSKIVKSIYAKLNLASAVEKYNTAMECYVAAKTHIDNAQNHLNNADCRISPIKASVEASDGIAMAISCFNCYNDNIQEALGYARKVNKFDVSQDSGMDWKSTSSADSSPKPLDVYEQAKSEVDKIIAKAESEIVNNQRDIDQFSNLSSRIISNEILSHELAIASDIQRSLLPYDKANSHHTSAKHLNTIALIIKRAMESVYNDVKEDPGLQPTMLDCYQRMIHALSNHITHINNSVKHHNLASSHYLETISPGKQYTKQYTKLVDALEIQRNTKRAYTEEKAYPLIEIHNRYNTHNSIAEDHAKQAMENEEQSRNAETSIHIQNAMTNYASIASVSSDEASTIVMDMYKLWSKVRTAYDRVNEMSSADNEKYFSFMGTLYDCGESLLELTKATSKITRTAASTCKQSGTMTQIDHIDLFRNRYNSKEREAIRNSLEHFKKAMDILCAEDQYQLNNNCQCKSGISRAYQAAYDACDNLVNEKYEDLGKVQHYKRSGYNDEDIENIAIAYKDFAVNASYITSQLKDLMVKINNVAECNVCRPSYE